MARKSRKHPHIDSIIKPCRDTVGYIRLSVRDNDLSGSIENQRLIISVRDTPKQRCHCIAGGVKELININSGDSLCASDTSPSSPQCDCPKQRPAHLPGKHCIGWACRSARPAIPGGRGPSSHVR